MVNQDMKMNAIQIIGIVLITLFHGVLLVPALTELVMALKYVWP
jgi:hypothetical protein